jgi:hypothetical protein
MCYFSKCAENVIPYIYIYIYMPVYIYIHIYIYILYLFFSVFILPGTSTFLCYSVLQQFFSFEVVIIRPGTTGYHGRILCSVVRQQVF